MTKYRAPSLIVKAAILLIIINIAIYFSFRWIDKQNIPTNSNARSALRFVAAIYPLLPGSCNEKCVARTIKIAHLVALSQYGKKSPVNFAKDIGIGFSLLNSSLINGGLPDKTAQFEIALERLLYFNRMNAFAINSGSHLGIL